MYSTNGRVNEKKETANVVKPTTYKLICQECGFIEENKSKVFGELDTCKQCASENVKFI